jgi:phage terminase large subunit-like protein
VSSAIEIFDAACPFILGNPYCPHFPHPKQAKFLGAHVAHYRRRSGLFECLFGGAAGGGKSDALLMAAAQYAWRYPHFRGLLLRRSYAELARAGALMSRAIEWWVPAGVKWNGGEKKFTFPSGATVEFGYHEHPTHNARYQGGEWHLVAFDELTHWPDESAFEWLSSRIRKQDGDPIPLRLLAASNPGSAGHVWVKERFVGGTSQVTGAPIKPRSMFIPSRIEDNPSLDQDAYRETLMHMHPTIRAQLLEGDWSARDPGDYFRAEWFGPLLDHEASPVPDGSLRIRWWDLAASEKDTAARTAGVLMARAPAGARFVEHATAFRATPGKRDARIVQQAKIDGPGVIVGIEIEPGSGGVAQFESLKARLNAEGFRCVGRRPSAVDMTDRERRVLSAHSTSDRGKEARADPVAACLERGHQRRGECPDTGEPWWGTDQGRGYASERDGLRLYAGPWTQSYLDELEGFPGVELKDWVDATSGAWAWLEAHPPGGWIPLGERRRQVVGDVLDIHPADRERTETDKRWTP